MALKAPRPVPDTSLVEWLLGSELVDTFWQEHWEKQVLPAKHNCPNYFDDLPGIEELDVLLSNTEMPATHFDLAKDSKPIPKESYTAGAVVDMQRALSLHYDGATIILRALHNWNGSLQKLRMAAEAAFNVPAQVNVYLTPENNQSTPPHWDTHDLFILQLEGSKCWRLYESSRALPLEDERFREGIDFVGPLKSEIILERGDVLYLPRGAIHAPVSEAYSVHASLGLRVMRWTDLVGELLNVGCDENVVFRQAVPKMIGSGEADAKKIRTTISKLLHKLTSEEELLRIALENVSRRFIESRDAYVGGNLTYVARPPMLSSNSIVCRRDRVSVHLTRDSQRVFAHWRGGSISLPLEQEEALDFLSKRVVFRIDDVPGPLSSKVKIAIVSTLIGKGLLVESAACE